ncbi:EFR1 family ferrodoxin [Desulfosporosinus sp. PR]|uniref:EFR1 family ferrodoxin n=1 Tax=Candidatus Desulfosporosinus nitrosoreducens TaxID=3401928 RepID=UPI0027EC3491|nr:EFR1 family ferrodoxin [Desulfosporosinus sp. PR]MDQ7096879.1 EFR1 family ferrodoxin [Desulfosporosinus sp. PR]
MSQAINSMYFSPTGTTKKIVLGIARKLAESTSGKPDQETAARNIDFTLPGIRLKPVSFSEQDVVIIGVPVYAGRVPNVLLNYLNTISGRGALAIPIVVYGNRNYDDALIELRDILEANGFKVLAAGAFIGEHSFSLTLAQNRPDEKDMAIAEEFAKGLYVKLSAPGECKAVAVRGNQPYRNYYKPKNKDGNPVDIRKVTPKTNDQCTNCKLCVEVCPMGSINPENVSELLGICIKCGACIKKCPTQAKYYDDPDYLRHKEELEIEYAARQEPDLFV